jgi:predicted phage-related endonuclease
MAYTVIHCEQRSSDWFAARAGRLTGSCAADVLAFSKKDGKTELEPRKKLRARLVCERLTGIPAEEQYIGRYAEYGAEHENAAIGAYEAETGRIVRRSGFLAHDEFRIGCSLDGHVGDPMEGIVEAKCPKPETHLAYVREGIAPPDYRPQILHNLWVTGAAWCDFVSFDDRFQEERLRLFIVRVPRVEAMVQEYAAQALKFLAEVEREVRAMQTCAEPAAVLERVIA